MSSKLWMRSIMASSEILEGVFAINKPSSLSSAEVLRRLQTHFLPSRLFAPLLAREANSRSANPYQKRRRHDKHLRVKLGHGGTLDPLATGVLICGVGSGTKSLSRFLECTKSYETVVLFGAATDSDDIVGKRLALADYAHVTREMVEEALAGFRGKIMQRPPLFSALRMQGKRLYEYAREGLPLPKEIQERPVEVLELEVVEWMDGGQHAFRWPEEVAGSPEREFAEKFMESVGEKETGEAGKIAENGERKRKVDDEDEEVAEAEQSPPAKKVKVVAKDIADGEPVMSGALPPAKEMNEPTVESTSQSAPLPPAVRLKMTVTSGFYVRSLCHDLGAAVGSLGLMASLVRTRQGDFELGKNVLEYDELDEGEKVWGPKIGSMLEEWTDQRADEVDDGTHGRSLRKKESHSGRRDNGENRERRNSSSVEP